MRCVGLFLASLLPTSTLSFQNDALCHMNMNHRGPLRPLPRLSVSNGNGDTGTDEDCEASELDELTPPSVSFSRHSILFGDDPPTQRNNAPLRFWRGTKSALPPIVTGAWRDDGMGDKKPLENIYNLTFVRFPTFCCLLVYVRNLLMGHPLVMDIGDGMFEVPPVVVFGVLFAILR